MPIPRDVRSGTPIDSAHMNQLLAYLRNELRVTGGPVSERPSGAGLFQLYYNTTSNQLEIWNGRAWVNANT